MDSEQQKPSIGRPNAGLVRPVLWLLPFLILLLLLTAVLEQKPRTQEPLIVISLDGFRHDYIEIVKRRFGHISLPNFDRLMREGVRAMRCINVFPTSTLPNHQTLVTGLYPQHHGVTANTMFDERLPGRVLSMLNETSLSEDPWLDGWPEPIWHTAQRHGVLTGTMLWPITDRPVDGDVPFQRMSQFKYNAPGELHYPNKRRVDDVIGWLTSSRYNLGLVLVYFSDIDIMGHFFGPHSVQTAEAIIQLDGVLGYFLDKLEQYDLRWRTNLIVLSDHGMTEISKDRIIVLEDFVDSSWYTFPQLTPVGLIYPVPGTTESATS
ncbi:unnamed protein product [Dibothriocephalus latus]|uniref:Uncharacterized protein n=1 Tax=Dibothriocephalus latus TaxID=60516 RepID=A0A3P7M2N7_DIBLA|nr:unnamed protein product [Dibothriocephalus latus]